VNFDPSSPLGLTVLFLIGAIASAINTVAGGGSLISFPTLTLGFGIDDKVANATNALGLWPGSLGGALGYRNLYDKCKHHLKVLILPTLLGSIGGAFLLKVTSKETFAMVVPFLLLFASILLWIQPAVKSFVARRKGQGQLSFPVVFVIQLLVATYGGYFGAGMGIMMLAAFSLFMDANMHEINAVKNWLGVVINAVASAVFITQGMVLPIVGLVMAAGSIVGGYFAGKWSQRFDPDKMRIAIACYGVVMAGIYAWQTWT
jgi:uncharacterized membrane protein YfcA